MSSLIVKKIEGKAPLTIPLHVYQIGLVGEEYYQLESLQMAIALHLTGYIVARLSCKRKLNVSFSGSNFFQFFKAHVRGVAIEPCTRLEDVAPI